MRNLNLALINKGLLIITLSIAGMTACTKAEQDVEVLEDKVVTTEQADVDTLQTDTLGQEDLDDDADIDMQDNPDDLADQDLDTDNMDNDDELIEVNESNEEYVLDENQDY